MAELTDFHLFWGEAMAAAERHAAAMEADGADDFAQQLYREYLEQGAPKPRKKWLATRLADAFPCMDAKPKWVGEPAWLYHQGQPMVFLHQFQVSPAAHHLIGHMSLGETLYMFGARHRLGPGPDDGWTDIYRISVQTCEGDTVGEIPGPQG
jgi:hypothetical protein